MNQRKSEGGREPHDVTEVDGMLLGCLGNDTVGQVARTTIPKRHYEKGSNREKAGQPKDFVIHCALAWAKVCDYESMKRALLDH